MAPAPKRVVVLEDKPETVTLLKAGLEDLKGHQVTVFPSGGPFLDAIRSNQLKPTDVAVLIFDNRMPGVDGPAALRALATDPQLRPFTDAFLQRGGRLILHTDAKLGDGTDRNEWHAAWDSMRSDPELRTFVMGIEKAKRVAILDKAGAFNRFLEEVDRPIEVEFTGFDSAANPSSGSHRIE